MNSATLSPKFQLVIPKEIRKKLDLKPGQRIQFAEKNGRVEIRPILTPDQLIGFLKGPKPLVLEREPDRDL
jgi:AbrB family looped-hinge helix DNA binding protein